LKIVFLASCKRDLAWFRIYYKAVFSAGKMNAKLHYAQSKLLLRDNPFIGHPTEENGVRELPISRTPFSFIYRVTPDRVEVIRVWDQRADRPASWTGNH
jgi:hypothetical protein